MAKIVIIDDDDVTTGIVAQFLEAEGHVVIEVGNGDDAIDVILNQEADLVILDQHLPGKSGMQLLSELRALPAAVDLPIMMLTGRGSRLHIELADKSGADDYITKPFDLRNLSTRVRSLLKGSAISRLAHADEGPGSEASRNDDIGTE